MTAPALLTGAILLAWILIAVELARGSARVPRASDLDPATLPTPAPSLSVIVAARDEAEHVGAAMRTLLALDYPSYEVIAVDDRSSDGTGAILDLLAVDDPRLKVLHVTTLPPGWLGKNHALHAATALARGEWLLFTDADCSFAPDLLRRAIGHAERTQLDHLVLGPRVRGEGPLLRALLATFALSFSLATRPWHAADPARAEHIGIGAFNLVRARALAAVGGHTRIRLRPDDDIKLGLLIKQAGLRQQFVEGSGLLTVPWYPSALAMVRGLEKNAFAFLDYSVARALAAMLVTFAVGLGPWLLLPFVHGAAFACALASAALSALLCAVAARRTLGLPPLYGLGFPLGVAMMLVAIANSTWRVLRDGGVRWRGTLYPLAELRGNRL